MAEQHNPFTSALKRVIERREHLPRDDARQLLNHILDVDDFGSEIRVAALLGALASRGETEDELAGFVDCLRARMVPIPLAEHERAALVDTCGTGGDLSGTFNISTAAALIAAAAGAIVAKHGNRAVTSRCGSADVLEGLGVPVDLTPEETAGALRTHGFAFLPAPSLQPAMKAVLPIRRALGVRTAFNILGPMTNPAGARAQVLGVYTARLVPVVAGTLAKLDTRAAFVVHGGGMDEFSICGPTMVGQVMGDQVEYGNVFPEAFGLQMATIGELAGGDAETNAEILRRIFAGLPGACRDAAVMNAAAVLVTADLAGDFMEGARMAEAAIDDGKVAALVAALAAGRTTMEG